MHGISVSIIVIICDHIASIIWHTLSHSHGRVILIFLTDFKLVGMRVRDDRNIHQIGITKKNSSVQYRKFQICVVFYARYNLQR